MPGTILGAEARRSVAYCHIQTIKYVTDRKGLVTIYRAARLSLVKGPLFEEVCKALSTRAKELGVYKKGVI